MPPVALIETALRHGQQTMLVSRLRSRHAVPLASALDRCGLSALDVFGGATFEADLRFLAEDPFERLAAIRAAAPHTPLSALLRGQALTAHRQMPDDVVDAFVKAAADAGIDVFRCYDSLNDSRNLERTCVAVHAAGKQAEAAMIYSESPVHSVAGFVTMGERLKELGYDALCIYDPAGLLGAGVSAALVRGLIDATGLPVTVHSGALTGQAGLAYLGALDAGAAGLDVALAPLAGGSSLPATDALVHALVGTPHQTLVDADRLAAATALLEETMVIYQGVADPAAWRLDTSVLRTQLPPAAVEHLLSELHDRAALDRLAEVQREIPRVRVELGYPPLITPIAQIVATQAVYNVCDGRRYTTISQEVKDYCLGLYGSPPGPIDPGIRRIVNGKEEPITCRPADLLEPGLDAARKEMEREDVPIPSAHAVVMYALFPMETAALLRGEAVAEVLGDEPRPEGEAPAVAAVAEPSADAPAVGVVTAAPAGETRELTVEVDGETYSVRVSGPAGTFGGGGAGPAGGNGAAVATGSAQRRGTIVAPMQGLILKLPVAVGDSVAIGDTVAVLEAMKMQNDVVATTAGAVREIYIAEGTIVAANDPLLLIE